MAQPELTESVEMELVLSVFSVAVVVVVASSHFPSLQVISTVIRYLHSQIRTHTGD